MKKMYPVLLTIIVSLVTTGCPTPQGSTPSGRNEITSFGFDAAANDVLSNNVTATIDGTDITLTVPYGTDVTALVASFTTTGRAVHVADAEQESGITANDFSRPVIYQVTSAKGSTRNYHVQVITASFTSKEITAFTFSGAANSVLTRDIEGTIDGTSIVLAVPYGTDVTALVATFTTTGVSVRVGGSEQQSGVTENDFSEPVTYRVIAANDSTQDYTVSVNFSMADVKAITAFSLTAAANDSLSDDVVATIDGTQIELIVPYGTDVTALVATFTIIGSSIRVDGTPQHTGNTPNDFTRPVRYLVEAENGSTERYTVTVSVASITDKEITSFCFTSERNAALARDISGSIDGTTISVNVPYGTNLTGLIATYTVTGISVHVGGTIQHNGITANDFSGPLTYRVTAANGSEQLYTVSISIAAAATESSAFGNPMRPGDTATLALSGSQELTMVYAKDQGSISFPSGLDDNSTATVTTPFWVAQTEFTNGQAVNVLQWAYDTGNLVSHPGSHNEVNSTTIQYGGQRLMWFTEMNNRIRFNDGVFSVEPGFENHPLAHVTWYGAVILCNWLTEMRDGHTDNVVYLGITPNWKHTNTSEWGWSRNGYRLPSGDEWEYAARYLGTIPPSTGGPLDSERLFGNDNPEWTNEYYWTPGNYASGAIADRNDEDASMAVAVFYGLQSPHQWPISPAAVASRGPAGANALGLFDMSGNVYEFGFDQDPEFPTWNEANRLIAGGSWQHSASALSIGSRSYSDGEPEDFGFRLFRTAD